MEFDHEKYMKRCYELAIDAGKKGFDTFGAVLLSEGEIIAEAENTADYQKKLFGHDVILMSEALVSSKETIFYGDPAAYKVNIFKALDVKPFETATTTNLQWRGACLADGELLDTNAFVRFART